MADGNGNSSNGNSNTMPSVHKVLQGGLQQLRRAQEEFNRLHPEQVKNIVFFKNVGDEVQFRFLSGPG